MKNLLVVVDYQNDFVTGSLGFEKAKIIEPYIAKKIKEFESNDDDVVFTLDTHQNSSYFDSEEGKWLKIKHCIEGTEGHELYGSIKELSTGHALIEKETFGSIEFAVYLSENQYDEITLVGVVTNICVIANAIMAKSSLPNAHIIIDSKGCASNDEEKEKAAYLLLDGMGFEVR